MLGKYNRDNIWGREGSFSSMGSLILPVISSAVIKTITLHKPLRAVRSKVKERVNKELEPHQLQPGACTRPPYIWPFNLFLHLNLLPFPLRSPHRPVSLQGSSSSLLLGPRAAARCLPLPSMVGLGRGPRAPQPRCPLSWGWGKLDRRLWKFYIVIVFMGRVG